MFDEFLRERATQTGQPYVPFDRVKDYELYVDGKPRIDGTRSFLSSRGIDLPDGREDDPPDAQTSYGLGNRKNQILLGMIAAKGVDVYQNSVRYVRAVRDNGLRRAVVSSSENCREVLEAAHIEDLFEVRIDGIVAKRDHLRGKPAPDTYLAGARVLGLEPADAAVFEDALAGVEAGRTGGFGYVVGIDRLGQADALHKHGADVVVTDLAQLLRPS
jgi:HAD superfamily hydrolase (TIGR01509 family)